MADIPGLIEGAADGAGLGIRFLKHLTRTRILLHIVDAAPHFSGEDSDAIESIEKLEHELEVFSATLAKRERWLVINKIDLLDSSALQDLKEKVAAYAGDRPVFYISALAGRDLDPLRYALMERLEEIWRAESEEPELRSEELATQKTMQAEGRERIAMLSALRTLERTLVKQGVDPDGEQAQLQKAELLRQLSGSEGEIDNELLESALQSLDAEDDDFDDDYDVEVEYVRD